MGNILVLLVAGVLALGLIRLLLMPMRLIWKLVANGVCGIALLWLCNLTAGITGLAIPVNPVTALIAGGLGLPGIILLAVAAVLF